ncbi:MAG: zf-TFIIB domain-containing protein [Planctomycetota bacterium]|nr:zf-TFIIB domain-containing protein [Planctomycetota bacterium]
MRCPNCNEPLRALEYEGVSIQTCDGCGGEFLDGVQLAHVVKTREARFAGELADALANYEPITGVPIPEPVRDRSCPACQNEMQVVNYGGDTGVFIDRCGVCGGVWLDHEELENVQILTERWQDEAPEAIRAIAAELEAARQRSRESVTNAFSGSRFSFVNALINRILDAA